MFGIDKGLSEMCMHWEKELLDYLPPTSTEIGNNTLLVFALIDSLIIDTWVRM